MYLPKDESEFLAKKKTFEANIFNFLLNGEPISKFWGTVNQTTYLTVSLCSTICDVYASWKFFMCPTPHTPWKFLPFNPPPHPLGISIDHPYGGMDIFWNHTFKLWISVTSNLIHSLHYCIEHEYVWSHQRKRRNVPTHVAIQPETHAAIVSLLLLVPLADNFSQNLSRSSLSIFALHIEYSAFTKNIVTERNKCNAWIDSRISAALHWIEIDTAEMRLMNQA